MKGKLRCFSRLLLILSAAHSWTFGQETVFLEAESFAETGGWKIDQQSFDVIGSSYLLQNDTLQGVR